MPDTPVFLQRYRRASGPTALKAAAAFVALLTLSTPVVAQEGIPESQRAKVEQAPANPTPKATAKAVSNAEATPNKGATDSGADAGADAEKAAEKGDSEQQATSSSVSNSVSNAGGAGAANGAAQDGGPLGRGLGGPLGGRSMIASVLIFALFLISIGINGWLFFKNARLKRELAEAQHGLTQARLRGGAPAEGYHPDAQGGPRDFGRNGGQQGTRFSPPYPAQGAVDGDPNIVGGDAAPDYHRRSAEPAPSAYGDRYDSPPTTPNTGHPTMAERQGFGATHADQGAAPAFAPPAPPPPPRAALSKPLAEFQGLIARAASLTGGEFRAAAQALGPWREVDVTGTGGTLHMGEDDGLPRPLIAIMQDNGAAAVVPSAQYARDFAFQNYKIRNNDGLRGFFDLELSSRNELALIKPALVEVVGQELRIVERGVLSGFSE